MLLPCRSWMCLAAVTLALLFVRDRGCFAADLLSDPKLERSVSLEARHVGLDELLARISSQTGVPLRAEGMTADLRCTALVTGQPAGQVLRRIALVHHLTWKRSEAAPEGGLVLYESKQDREAAVRETEREWESFREHIRSLLSRYAQGGAPQFQDEVPQQSARIVLALPDAVLERALLGEVVRIPFGQLPPAARDAYVRRRTAIQQFAVKTYKPDNAKILPGGGEVRVGPPQPLTPAEQTGLVLAVDRDLGDGIWANFRIGEFTDAGDADGVSLPGGGPDMAPAELLRSRREFGDRSVHRGTPEHLRLSHADHAQTWDDYLIAFATENRISVISDAYDPLEDGISVRPVPLPTADASPESVLDRLCIPYNYTWEGSQPILALRRRNWFSVRERAIPVRLAHYWREVASERGSYSLEDLSRMAVLNEGQRHKVERYAGKDAGSTMIKNREFLLLYRSLNASQQARMRGEGLPVTELSVGQRRTAEQLVRRKRPAAVELAHSLKQIRTEEQPEKAAAVVTFEFRDGEHVTEVFNCKARPLRDPWKVFDFQFIAPAGREGNR